MDETTRIALLARVLGDGAPAAGVEVGIGDDAAVLEAPRPGSRLVWTIDEQVEGVHFRRELLAWRDVGWRSFMAAASDVAAMGASPWCALCAMVLPGDVDGAVLREIALGQREAADAVRAPVVGGNLSRGPAVSLATTLLGTCERAVERRGAEPGDGVWLAGRVGLAAAGFAALARAREGGREARGAQAATDAMPPALCEAVDAWRRPRALVAEGRAMGAVARAAVDVSDGLARDAGHLAEASGVRVVLDESALRSDAALIAAAGALGADPLELALHGGEDYALVAASRAPIPGFRRIGEVREGRGLALRDGAGERSIEPRGFDHFAT
ncbi:MAG TPA: thiamine-phosphate kinase [Polyangiaceae bacterium]|nr:thiamine-phosphate kinase [Polyangiaceae bacterium]